MPWQADPDQVMIAAGSLRILISHKLHETRDRKKWLSKHVHMVGVLSVLIPIDLFVCYL